MACASALIYIKGLVCEVAQLRKRSRHSVDKRPLFVLFTPEHIGDICVMD